MFGRFISAFRGFGPATEFEGYLSNLLIRETGGQGPTVQEARKQYRVIVSYRSGFIDRY